MLLYWHHYAVNGKRIELETDDDTIAAHFLHLLHGKKPEELWIWAMNTSLNLYAEHEFNASTFAARVIAGTGSDIYSAVVGAHRRAARTQAWRRQRGLVRNPEPLRQSQRSRSRHPETRRRQGGHHRLRPSGLYGRRSAQRGDQGGCAATVARCRNDGAVRYRRSASKR